MNVSSQTFWIAIGFAGQALFSARFLIQWIASERAKKSVVPKLFWYFSLAGGATLFAYAVWREDPVFMVGQAFGLIVYIRNLWRCAASGGIAQFAWQHRHSRKTGLSFAWLNRSAYRFWIKASRWQMHRNHRRSSTVSILLSIANH
ncbi:MAG: hypothetical protein EBT32_11700 [Betaproteobacteria bacterium]|nr:hypothetical protein [Betaproteobacteria bacterium]